MKNQELEKKIRDLKDEEDMDMKKNEKDIEEWKEKIKKLKDENDQQSYLDSGNANKMREKLQQERKTLLKKIKKGKKTPKISKQVRYLNEIKQILTDILESA